MEQGLTIEAPGNHMLLTNKSAWHRIVAPDGSTVAYTPDGATAGEILACVNALAGMDPEAVAEVVEAAEAAGSARWSNKNIDPMLDALLDLREALTQLKGGK